MAEDLNPLGDVLGKVDTIVSELESVLTVARDVFAGVAQEQRLSPAQAHGIAERFGALIGVVRDLKSTLAAARMADSPTPPRVM